MNCSGIVRRVDELGRVVIPIEIRRLLGIKEGESLEFLINNGCIELRKKLITDGNYDFFSKIFSKLDEVVEEEYFLTDREKIFHASDKRLVDKNIGINLNNLLSVHEDTIINNETLEFGDITIKSSFYIYPYYCESDIAGFIVLYNVSSIDKYIKLLKFLTSYIHNKLSL